MSPSKLLHSPLAQVIVRWHRQQTDPYIRDYSQCWIIQVIYYSLDAGLMFPLIFNYNAERMTKRGNKEEQETERNTLCSYWIRDTAGEITWEHRHDTAVWFFFFFFTMWHSRFKGCVMCSLIAARRSERNKNPQICDICSYLIQPYLIEMCVHSVLVWLLC